ncbi:hypothetical protein ACH5RR_029799 [Cinchona calisaya]|uniref:Uncharacterized protein n=1 Tax=Cinchona calisaya TaxID=153742 RepID=A0ABD2YTX9_9GENT
MPSKGLISILGLQAQFGFFSFKDYVVCIIKRKSKKEEESKEENLQGGIEEGHPELAIPDEYIDDRGYYFPTPINSYNGFADIANYTEVQQYYPETLETIIPSHHVPLMLSAQGYQIQYLDTAPNIIEACQYQNHNEHRFEDASSDSQSIAPFATGNQLVIYETISRENAMEIEQQPIAKPPSPAILPLNVEGGER